MRKKESNGNRKRKRVTMITRVMCPAELRVKLCKESGQYVVSRFNPTHS